MSDPNHEITRHARYDQPSGLPERGPSRLEIDPRFLASTTDRSLTVWGCVLSIASGVVSWICLLILWGGMTSPGSPPDSLTVLLLGFPTALFCLGAFLLALFSVIAYSWAPEQQTGRLVAWLALLNGALLVIAVSAWFLWYWMQ